MRNIVWPLLFLVQGQDQKLPVPGVADQKKAEAEIRSVFKEEFAKKTRDGKRNLAARLLTEAADAKNTAASRYVVLLLSRDLAVEALDVGTIIGSIDQLGKLYDVARPPLAGATFSSSCNALKISALNSAQKHAASPEDSALLGDAYLKVAEDALKEKLFDDALSAAQAAERYAKASKAASALERAGQLVKEIPELKKEDELFGSAVTTKADDPAAKLVKGRYSLFVVGDDKVGIENLVGCSDEGLKSAAKLEAANPTSAEAMVDIAEAWLALSKKDESSLQKRRYQDRARTWFDEAIKNAGGILRARIEKRLAEIDTPGSSMMARLREGLVGWWRFEEGGGIEARDSSPGRNHGTLMKGPEWTKGKMGRGLKFNGVDNHVVVSPKPYASVVNTFSMTLWVLPAGPKESYAIYPTLGSIAYGSVEHVGAGILVSTGRIAVIEHTGNYLHTQINCAKESKGWFHLAVVYTDRIPKLYVDGKLAETGPVSPKTVHPGCGIGTGVDAKNFIGILDEFRIYNRALTEAEVQALASQKESEQEKR